MNHRGNYFIQSMRAREGSWVKDKVDLYQSSTCHGVTNFYKIAKSSFTEKIWCVKVWWYCSVPFIIKGDKIIKNHQF